MGKRGPQPSYKKPDKEIQEFTKKKAYIKLNF